MVQEIGSVATPEGRIIAFPNTLQHRVEPFELVDKTVPGHRRFVVLWLVDPHYRVLSTRNVPPQQREWWERAEVELIEDERNPTQGEQGAKTASQVLENESLMTLAEAKEYRLELMKERTRFGQTVEDNLDQYNFCEH